uniref:Uncharacterized protein n=1 Tax=Medicago truncatula TaxID=3880 RepID=I3SA32_MEDTR|nr:unknown [Medicago truncatula]
MQKLDLELKEGLGNDQI